MRLIDADALAKKWQDVLDEKADEKGSVAYITFELFIDRLKEEPTIEAEPVKHGRWEESADGDGAVCSHCKEDFCNIIHETDRFKRCPNCGAKMDVTDTNAGDKEDNK